MCKNCTTCRKICVASGRLLGLDVVTTKLNEPSCSDQFFIPKDFHMKTKTKTIAYIVYSIAAAVLVLTAQISLASSATWLLSPQDSAWENANNWTPGGPPMGRLISRRSLNPLRQTSTFRHQRR